MSTRQVEGKIGNLILTSILTYVKPPAQAFESIMRNSSLSLLLHLLTIQLPDKIFFYCFSTESEDTTENTVLVGQGADGAMSPKQKGSAPSGLPVDVDSLRIAGNT